MSAEGTKWKKADGIGDYPAKHHLDDVPWFATEGAYCQSNSLQMIAAQKGIEEPRGYFDFLMGFTYGAVEMPGRMGFFPYTDPETGFVVAAPHLGLQRRYYVTDDEALYIDALRYYLAQGYPVRVGLDAAVLYDLEEEMPHSEVLVGYDETGFYYYETVCVPEMGCEPCHLPPGEQGLHIPDQALLDAVLGQAKALSYQSEADQIATRLRDAATAERESGEIFLVQGQHTIRLEYYEHTGHARVRL